jgi:hypothetical protein
MCSQVQLVGKYSGHVTNPNIDADQIHELSKSVPQRWPGVDREGFMQYRAHQGSTHTHIHVSADNEPLGLHGTYSTARHVTV